MNEVVERLKEFREWALAGEGFDMRSSGRVRIVEEVNVCGTTKCAAGYGAWRLVPEEWAEAEKMAIDCLLGGGSDDDEVEFSDLPNGRQIEDAGREWFGITEDEANWLFHADRYWLGVVDELIVRYSDDEA